MIGKLQAITMDYVFDYIACLGWIGAKVMKFHEDSCFVHMFWSHVLATNTCHFDVSVIRYDHGVIL